MSKYEYDHNSPFEAYVTNLGKYNEGELVGEWVSFPTTEEKLEEVYEKIGIGDEYEEIFISDYDNYAGIPLENEYPNMDELNYLATKLEDMDEHEYNTFVAAVDAEGVEDIKDMINIALNVEEGNIYLDEGVTSEEDLGREAVSEGLVTREAVAERIDFKELGEAIIRLDYSEEESEDLDAEEIAERLFDALDISDIPKTAISDYLDYEDLGKEIAASETSEFTDKGYVQVIDEEDLYNGIEDIPDDVKVSGGEDDDVEEWDDPIE